MRVVEALNVAPLEIGHVVAGHGGLQRRVTWVHVVDLPEPGPWIGMDQILLSTGFAWPSAVTELISLIRELDSRGVAAVCLAVPSFHDHFPEAAKLEADRVGLPLIEVPWEIPFARISENVNRAILTEQQKHRQHADAIHRSLTRSSIEAETLDDIIQEFSRLIKRPVVFEDIEGGILASSLAKSVKSLSNKDGIPAEEKPIGVLKTLVQDGYWGNIHSARNASRIALSKSYHSNVLIVSPVWLKHELEGIIWIPEIGVPLGEVEIQAAEHAATVIALHIARDRAIVNVEQRLRYSLIDSLLDGQFRGDALGLERAAMMGYKPDQDHTVTIFILNEPMPLNRAGYLRRERFVSRLSRRMIDREIAPLISPSMNEVTMISPKGTRIDQLTDGLLDESISACVGATHASATGIRTSYLEARSVIPWARPGHLTHHKDTVLPRIFDGDKMARSQFIDEILTPLYENIHSETYIYSLKTLASCNFNQSRAAEQLCIHKKTMQYRTNNLQRVTKLNFQSATDRFKIQLLFHLIELKG